jgi:hypothetical protein
MSEHNAALLKKFEGKGWALTCSSASENELSSIIGDAVSADEESKTSTSDVPMVHYESDWG